MFFFLFSENKGTHLHSFLELHPKLVSVHLEIQWKKRFCFVCTRDLHAKTCQFHFAMFAFNCTTKNVWIILDKQACLLQTNKQNNSKTKANRKHQRPPHFLLPITVCLTHTFSISADWLRYKILHIHALSRCAWFSFASKQASCQLGHR